LNIVIENFHAGSEGLSDFSAPTLTVGELERGTLVIHSENSFDTQEPSSIFKFTSPLQEKPKSILKHNLAGKRVPRYISTAR
jgi:hypothetical protein